MVSKALSIFAAAEELPDAPGIVTDQETLTYAQLAVRVRRVVDWLRAERGEPTRAVAVIAALRPETLIAFYALFEVGAPVVAIHPRATAVERSALIASVGVTRVLDETWSDLALPPPAASTGASGDIADEQPLAILFTSGTSGAPKGVVLSRRAIHVAALASAANLGSYPADRWLLCMPLGHVGGLSVVVRCLVSRKPVVLVPWSGAVVPLLDALERHAVTLISLVPAMLRRIIDEQPNYRFPPSMRAVLLGGDAASPSLLADAAARAMPVLTTYGMTEACAQVATQRPGEVCSAEAGVGRPLSGVELRFVDGEVQVRGPMLMSGYFPIGGGPSPFIDGGWFPTGDLGEIDASGRLHLRGRKSDRLITGGENVDPLEVERVLASCPGVASACVFGVPDERWGQIIAAALVPTDPGAPPALSSVAAHVAARLARFKCPSAYAICAAFELNASSKVDRKRTAAAAAGSLARITR